MNFLFYGTLMARGGYRGNAILEADLGTYGPEAEVRGLLFNTGAFPALVEGEGVVKGQLWTPHPGYEHHALYLCDQIEGYYPDMPQHSMYLRKKAKLIKPEGVSAYVYVWNRPVTGLEPIPSGSWMDREVVDV